MDDQQTIVLLAIVVAGLIVLLFSFGFFLLLFRHWVKALMSGAPVSIMTLLGMVLRGTPRSLAVEAYIQLKHRGSAATMKDVELAYLANRHRIDNSHDLVDRVERTLAHAEANG
jgi:uncharacterized protein YqfA (UPF0365 family)